MQQIVLVLKKQFRSNHNIQTAKIKIILTSKAAYTVKKSVPLYTTHNTTTCYVIIFFFSFFFFFVIIFLNETFRGKKSAKTDTKVYESYLGVSDSIPLEKEMAIYSSILAWRIPWTQETGSLQLMGSQQLDTTQRYLSFFLFNDFLKFLMRRICAHLFIFFDLSSNE